MFFFLLRKSQIGFAHHMLLFFRWFFVQSPARHDLKTKYLILYLYICIEHLFMGCRWTVLKLIGLLCVLTEVFLLLIPCVWKLKICWNRNWMWHRRYVRILPPWKLTWCNCIPWIWMVGSDDIHAFFWVGSLCILHFHDYFQKGFPNHPYKEGL